MQACSFLAPYSSSREAEEIIDFARVLAAIEVTIRCTVQKKIIINTQLDILATRLIGDRFT